MTCRKFKQKQIYLIIKYVDISQVYKIKAVINIFVTNKMYIANNKYMLPICNSAIHINSNTEGLGDQTQPPKRWGTTV